MIFESSWTKTGKGSIEKELGLLYTEELRSSIKLRMRSWVRDDRNRAWSSGLRIRRTGGPLNLRLEMSGGGAVFSSGGGGIGGGLFLDTGIINKSTDSEDWNVCMPYDAQVRLIRVKWWRKNLCGGWWPC